MISSAINVMKVDNNFLPLLVDHGVSTHRNGIRVNCTIQFLVPNSFKYWAWNIALAGIWTRDLCLTKATLYQAELPRHICKISRTDEGFIKVSMHFVTFNYQEIHQSRWYFCGGCRAWPNNTDLETQDLRSNKIGDPVLQGFVGSNPTSRIHKTSMDYS